VAKKEKTRKNKGGSGVDLKDRTGSDNKIQRPKKFKCVMFNDDYTPMDFVVAVLQTVFHKSSEEAYKLMLDVHTKDRGIAGVYSKEVADTKCNKCAQYAKAMGYPFLVQAEPE
jgi:ATP-dependent Clp protease adaptor protein ClpS